MINRFRMVSVGPSSWMAITTIACWLCCSSIALAQNQAAEPAPNISTGPNFIIDSLLVAALIGGAVYAVCRPSRRV